MTEVLTFLGVDLCAKTSTQARNHSTPSLVESRWANAARELRYVRSDGALLPKVLAKLPARLELLPRLQMVVHRSPFLIRVPLKRELGVEWRLDPAHKTEYTLESFTEEMAAAGLGITHHEVRWGEIWAEVVPDGS